MATRTITHTHRVPDTSAESSYDEREVVTHEHNVNVAARTIWFIGDLLLVLLGFRFVLAILGANPANAFANFIYSVSRPFVAPFFSLFSYNYQLGVARIEAYTLVAMAVYAVIIWALVRFVTLDRW